MLYVIMTLIIFAVFKLCLTKINQIMDFGFGGGQGASGTEPQNNKEPQNVNNNNNEPEPVDLNDPGDNNEPDDDKGDKPNDKPNDDSQDIEVVPGQVIEFDGHNYTVDDKGNLVNEEGAIFKEASEVKDWLKEQTVVDDNPDEISISSIQSALGVDITDENGKAVEFENTPDGIKSYINAVIESAQEEQQNAAINGVFAKYPILTDVLNYYIANGNSLEGFNEAPDYENITIDENNEAQQEAIIKAAWAQKKMTGDVNNYIAYLKSQNILFATATDELNAMSAAEKQYREELAQRAQEEESKHIAEMQAHWNHVHQVIDSKQIAGYQIPDTIIINRNGQKISATPTDFFNYLYQIDENGNSRYEHDLAAQKPEDRLHDEILRAYLTFTGGSYSNLVDMAVNKQKVATLKLQSKQRSAPTVRVKTPKAKSTDTDFGY